MNIVTLTVAIKETERFIDAALKAQARWELDWLKDSKRLNLTKRDYYTNVSKENAACKRASMELTRALSELRK